MQIKNTDSKEYYWEYESPLGGMILISDGVNLLEVRFLNDRFYKSQRIANCQKQLLKVFVESIAWMDDYFAGKNPLQLPTFIFHGTAFQEEVWQLLMQIPYGSMVTYKDLAEKIACKRGIKKMSAQAVGGAVGHNPLCILIPCHRVVGSNGSLTGYAAGIDKKLALLRLEGAIKEELFVPKK